MLTEPLIFPTKIEGLCDVVPGRLQMGVHLGNSFSVALMRFIEQKDVEDNVYAAPHSHGEEVTLVLKGGGTLFLPGMERKFSKGDIIIAPPRVPHTGQNDFGDEGECMRLNLVTPPREEYVARGGGAYYPVGQRGQRPQIPSAGSNDVEGDSFTAPLTCMSMGDDEMSEIRAGTFYRKHLIAHSVSVAVLKSLYVAHSPPVASAPSAHSHGEEVVVFLKGGVTLDVEGTLYEVGEGFGMIIPAGMMHGGGKTEMHYHDDECVRVSVVTPPRTDYGDDLIALRSRST